MSFRRPLSLSLQPEQDACRFKPSEMTSRVQVRWQHYLPQAGQQRRARSPAARFNQQLYETDRNRRILRLSFDSHPFLHKNEPISGLPFLHISASFHVLSLIEGLQADGLQVARAGSGSVVFGYLPYDEPHAVRRACRQNLSRPCCVRPVSFSNPNN